MEVEQGPIPVGEHEPLWRYLRLNTLFHYLSGKVFVPSIKTLRACDPTEGLPVVDHEWAMVAFSDEERSEMSEWVYQNRLSSDEKACYYANRDYPGANQKIYLNHYYEVLEESRYAWCWFKSKNESAAMWQAYGLGGVAVRTSVNRLSKALAATPRSWLVSAVKYLDRNCEAGLEMSWGDDGMKPWARRPFLVKRVEYQHEQEVRFVTICTGGRSGIPLEGLNPTDWIEEIVFWPGFPRSEAKALVQAVGKVCSEMAEQTRSSKLFERDPTSTLSTEVEEEFNNYIAESCHQTAQHWPQFMLHP